jgi:Flp pilus assembly protein CpaB
MSVELPQTDCFLRLPICRTGLFAILLLLLTIAITAGLSPPRGSRAPKPETVEVLVAAKDLPVGTVFMRDELKSAVKLKKLPKDALPLAYIANAEELLDKRLTRPVRAEETFNPDDLSKDTVPLPDGYERVSIWDTPVSRSDGFIGAGSRVDVLAWLRVDGTLKAFPLLVDVLVLAVDQHKNIDKQGTLLWFNLVSLAVTQKQARLLALAKKRQCALELGLRLRNKNTEADKAYDIDKVIKFLNDLPEIAPPPRPVKE